MSSNVLARAVPPALFGILLLYIGISSMAHELQYYSETPIADVRGQLLPITIGVALLLAALGVSRRSRAGYLLGLASAGLLIVAGFALIAIEVQYILQGRSGSQYGWVFIVAAGIWIAFAPCNSVVNSTAFMAAS